MSDFKIEKGVPIPESRGGRIPKYPWAELDIGDSFAVNGGYSHELRLRMGAGAAGYGKRHGKKFAVRRNGDDGVRVWRTE